MKREITQLIKDKMKSVGLNKLQLSIKLGVSPSIVTRWLKGNHNFTLNTLELISKHLNINFMHSIDFDGSNIELGKPNDMTDEQCTSIKALRGKTVEGYPLFVTAWMPNKEDLEALNSGKPLWLHVLSSQFPPVSLFTVDDNNEANS